MSVSQPTLIGVREEPHAADSIRRTKGRAGLTGFALVLLASALHGLPLQTGLVRALIGGVVCYFVGWALAVAIWRQLLRARAREAVARAVAAREERRR